MDLNREILGIISGLENQRPYSFIRSEVERYGAVGGEYIKVRRILREWVAHFRDVHDETNHSKNDPHKLECRIEYRIKFLFHEAIPCIPLPHRSGHKYSPYSM